MKKRRSLILICIALKVKACLMKSDIGQKKIEDAIIVFTYHTRLFPNSGNVYDSLGEAYYTQGNKEKALDNYTKALALDPSLVSSKQMLLKLKAEL